MTSVKLTRYYMVSEKDYGDNKIVPVLDIQGNLISTVDATFFASMSLEGSAKLADGRVLNVNGGYAQASDTISQTLKTIADKQYRSHYGYVGLSNDCKRYFTYNVSPTMWGIGMHNFSLMPFVAVASDQRFYPFGTTLFIPELQGKTMPDGTTHAGYVYCCDTGGAIIGEHLDFFVGYKEWQLEGIIPDNVEVQVYSTPTKNS